MSLTPAHGQQNVRKCHRFGGGEANFHPPFASGLVLAALVYVGLPAHSPAWLRPTPPPPLRTSFVPGRVCGGKGSRVCRLGPELPGVVFSRNPVFEICQNFDFFFSNFSKVSESLAPADQSPLTECGRRPGPIPPPPPRDVAAFAPSWLTGRVGTPPKGSSRPVPSRGEGVNQTLRGRADAQSARPRLRPPCSRCTPPPGATG